GVSSRPISSLKSPSGPLSLKHLFSSCFRLASLAICRVPAPSPVNAITARACDVDVFPRRRLNFVPLLIYACTANIPRASTKR
ncbi:hypothetical protein B0H19DRAFT_1382872, partial [Mycena capillaripes]